MMCALCKTVPATFTAHHEGLVMRLCEKCVYELAADDDDDGDDDDDDGDGTL